MPSFRRTFMQDIRDPWSNSLLVALRLVLVIVFGATPAAHAQIDITGLTLELQAVAPDRDTGKPVAVTFPDGLFGPAFTGLLSTPLSTQMDIYWNSPDKTTGVPPRENACTGKGMIIDQLQQAVRSKGSSFSAYDITCKLASKGRLLADRARPDLVLTYLLEHNSVQFTLTTPATCHAGHGTPLCPEDPRFIVSFDSKIVTQVHTAALCQLGAEKNGVVYTQNAKISGANATGAVAQVVDSLIHAETFSAAELAIERTTKQQPLPLDADLAPIRNSAACTGSNAILHRTLLPFRTLETVLQPPQPVLLQAIHAGIASPNIDAPDPWANSRPGQPTFNRPMISANQPLAVAGSTLQITGQNFPANIASGLSDRLPISLSHGGYGANSIVLGGVCWAGFTEVQWNLMGMTLSHRDAQVPGAPDGTCSKSVDAINLIPASTYDFRARDCDKFTCSPWSAPLRRMTAAAGGSATSKSTVTLIIDRNTECKPPWCSPAMNPRVGQPQANVGPTTSNGIPTSGGCDTPLCRVGMSSSAVKTATNPASAPCDTPLCRSSHSSAATVAANAANGGSSAQLNRPADKSIHTSQIPIPVGSANLTPQGTFTATVMLPASLAPGSHTISASNGDVEAEVSINVTTPNASRGASLMIIAIVASGESGCPNRPSGSILGDTNFMLFGAGFAAGTVTVYADKSMGTRPLGTASVHADGTFCEQMRGISGTELGPHTLLAIENGAVQAEAAINVVPPTQMHVN